MTGPPQTSAELDDLRAVSGHRRSAIGTVPPDLPSRMTGLGLGSLVSR
jgi:hypothetical protein